MSRVESYVTVGEHEIEVTIEYDAFYQRAYTSGLPEDCYPEDSEISLNSIKSLFTLPDGVTQEMITEAGLECQDRLIDDAWDDYHSRGENDDR